MYLMIIKDLHSYKVSIQQGGNETMPLYRKTDGKMSAKCSKDLQILPCTEGDFYYEGINKSFPYFEGDFGTQIKMLEMGYGTPGDGSGGLLGTF